MREIKFRAWDGKEIIFPGIERRVYLAIGNSSWGIWSSKTDESMFGSDDSEEVALMQYTGIKDKNGIEIYEGDYIILRRSSNRGESKVSGCIDDIFDMVYEIRRWLSNGGTVEVIGNKYETPELLK